MAIESKELAVAIPDIRTLLKCLRDHHVQIAARQRYRALIRKNAGLEIRFISSDATELWYYGQSRQKPRHKTFYHFREHIARPFRGFWKACINSLDNFDAPDISRLSLLARNLPGQYSRSTNAATISRSHNPSWRDSGGGCVIFPERLAVFKFKFAGVKLSAFAAYCLLMTGHIQPEDLIPCYHQRQGPSSASPAPGFWSSTVSYVVALSVQLTAAAMLAGIARFLVYIVESPLLLPSTILLTLYTLIDLFRHLQSETSASPSKTQPHLPRQSQPSLLTHLSTYQPPFSLLLPSLLNELTALLLEPFTGRLAQSLSLGTTPGFLTGLTKSLLGGLFCRRKTAVVAFVALSVQAFRTGAMGREGGKGGEGEGEEDMAFKVPLRQGIREFKGLVARKGGEGAREVARGVGKQWVVVLEGLDGR